MRSSENEIDCEQNSMADDKHDRPLVSIVAPAYNEEIIIENNLTELCQYMDSLQDEYRWELIIVNDGSSDETGAIAEAFAKTRDNIFVLHHAHNFQLGQALRYGFNQCLGDYVITFDLDLSYSPDHIKRMLIKLKEANAKIVIASPYMKGGKVSNVPWNRKIMSRWANFYLSLFVQKDHLTGKLCTYTGMVRAYDGRFLSKLNLRAMSMDVNPEILYKAMILRARIVEIPAHLKWRDQEKAKNKPKRKSSMRILRNILSSLISGFFFRPFMFYILPGIAFILIALYPIAWAFVHAFFFFGQVTSEHLALTYRISEAIAEAFTQSPHAFIVGGFALLVGIQLISLGLLALQKKKYFEELFYLGSCMQCENQKNFQKIEMSQNFTERNRRQN